MNPLQRYPMLVMLLVSVMPVAGVHAQTRQDIFKQETALTWLGIDFSQSRFIGDAGTVSATGMVDFYSRINYLVVSEPEKYNLNKTFDKLVVTPNIELVEKLNRTTDETKILSYNFGDMNRFTAEKIQEMVGNYNTGELKGLAVVFIMEGMSKPVETAAMWVTFFNAETRQVLLTVRQTGRAGGFGFRNYWANTIYEVMKSVRSREMKNWKKVYGK